MGRGWVDNLYLHKELRSEHHAYTYIHTYNRAYVHTCLHPGRLFKVLMLKT